tara:strand:+ start:3160 stop:3432 length:273 start_codon:yes stop_codon:yes gene_type:complete
MKKQNPRIVCKDGTSLSVQGSVTHYCSPRIDEVEQWQDYESVEVGYIEGGTPPESWREYADGMEFPNDIYAWVPVQLVLEFIEFCGGTEV